MMRNPAIQRIEYLLERKARTPSPDDLIALLLELVAPVVADTDAEAWGELISLAERKPDPHLVRVATFSLSQNALNRGPALLPRLDALVAPTLASHDDSALTNTLTAYQRTTMSNPNDAVFSISQPLVRLISHALSKSKNHALQAANLLFALRREGGFETLTSDNKASLARMLREAANRDWLAPPDSILETDLT